MYVAMKTMRKTETRVERRRNAFAKRSLTTKIQARYPRKRKAKRAKKVQPN